MAYDHANMYIQFQLDKALTIPSECKVEIRIPTHTTQFECKHMMTIQITEAYNLSIHPHAQDWMQHIWDLFKL